MASIRSDLYKGARLLGNVQSVKRGPTGVAKRYVRRRVYRKTNGWTQTALRAFKLW